MEADFEELPSLEEAVLESGPFLAVGFFVGRLAGVFFSSLLG